MKYYESYLLSKGYEVNYISAFDNEADIRELLPALKRRGVETIHFIDPSDNWLKKRLQSAASETGILLKEYPSPLFLNTMSEQEAFFSDSKKKFHQTSFYIDQRKKFKLLLDHDGKPRGGSWSYDMENRKKYPSAAESPAIQYPDTNKYFAEAREYTLQHFCDHYGSLGKTPLYPIDHASARAWFRQFLEVRFSGFGPYEDAILENQSILHHSVLSPLLNVGLIGISDVLHETVQYASQHDIRLNSLEGFVRQLIGWREFIRGIYEVKGSEERTRNFWSFSRKIPKSFYEGTTGIDPIDITIRKVNKTAYAHHIERLMVLGNFMLLCEFDPDDVYRWFMEMFIDAYDWVMVPNVYGMSQFADGGLMSSKPYISGSNYLMKMSDYKKGPWQESWDALFWRFMHVHRDFFTRNPRLGMLIKTFDNMPPEKRKNHLTIAEKFLDRLDESIE
jgi:deoxyribodipyrimidine photolyase-related protein